MLLLTTIVGGAAFLWPFFADHTFSEVHGQDLPCLLYTSDAADE